MDELEPPPGDNNHQYKQETEGQEILILEKTQNPSQLEKISSEDGLKTREVGEELDLYKTIKELGKETERISGELTEFCPYSEDCSEESIRKTNRTEIKDTNRIGIDPNCSKKKSYHCDVLKERLGDNGFKKYLDENLTAPPADYKFQ